MLMGCAIHVVEVVFESMLVKVLVWWDFINSMLLQIDLKCPPFISNILILVIKELSHFRFGEYRYPK